MIFKSVCVCVRVLMCVHAGTHMEVKTLCVGPHPSPRDRVSCSLLPMAGWSSIFQGSPVSTAHVTTHCRCVLCACLYLDSENANSGPHNLGSDLPPVPSQPPQEKGHGEDHVHEDTQSLRTLSSQVLTTLCQILQDQIKYHSFLDSFFQFLLEPKITA